MNILERDGWKCQHCGRRDQLQIHHMIRRSQSGADCEGNLIILCCACHRSLHLKGT
jgi:5-methylcytosine-specific restriction endonuclease McrA